MVLEKYMDWRICERLISVFFKKIIFMTWLYMLKHAGVEQAIGQGGRMPLQIWM